MNIKVLDASAIIHGYNPVIEEGEHYTTPEVLEEIVSKKIIVEQALNFGKLKIMSPSKESIKKVEEVVKKTGDNLSKQDIGVLALALDLNAILYTDDYGIQNVAKKLNIEVKGIAFKPTDKDFIWRKVCEGCKKLYPADYEGDICEICGRPLKRKMVKSRLKKRRK
ncbi:type II toxin-antitoxin system VapC family toxin [Methanocaldococcus fervens]|uniref:Ribonuclease VapC n=1 Tax=Methanocaldococcus fervens (strain DSM 4213 / JCM 15782 / AG86) TaxID=573064 RepID=C7P8Z5_METFA|nr:type II toxin-antitoxin system VapC family toxin [Methanocaldococcus fervens]ACV25027.1 PilT protein domain protein [Methanocaldococcus fervens AG86]